MATKGAEVTSGIAKSAKHVDSVATTGVKNIKTSSLNPDDIRFSQTTVSYNKIDRKTGKKFTYDDLVDNMKKDGWKGDPVDVVKMPDGKLQAWITLAF